MLIAQVGYIYIRYCLLRFLHLDSKGVPKVVIQLSVLQASPSYDFNVKQQAERLENHF